MVAVMDRSADDHAVVTGKVGPRGGRHEIDAVPALSHRLRDALGDERSLAFDAGVEEQDADMEVRFRLRCCNDLLFLFGFIVAGEMMRERAVKSIAARFRYGGERVALKLRPTCAAAAAPGHSAD